MREFPESPKGKRILLPRAKEAREIIPEKLAEQGAQVDVVAAYQTRIEDFDASPIRELLRNGEIDAITFTSSSTVRNFVELIGDMERVMGQKKPKIACIGPITAQTASEHRYDTRHYCTAIHH